MKLHHWSGVALLGWLGAVSVACGDDDGEDGPAPSPSDGGDPSGGSATGGFSTGGAAQRGGAAGMAGASDSAGEAGAGGSESSGGSATGGVPFPGGGAAPAGAHIPDVVPTQTGEVFVGDAVEGFEVTHSHYYVEGPAITDHYWLGVVVNDGDVTKCRLTVSVSIRAPGGAPVQFAGPVVAPMYRFEGLVNTVYCLAPGERGVALGQPLEIAPQFDAQDVTEVTYGIAGEPAGDIVRADWVALRSVVAEPQGLKSRVTGDLEKVSAAAIPGLAAVVFPKNTDGAPLVHFRVRDSRPSAPTGSVWHFQTPFYDGHFEDAYVFYEHGTPGAP
jgi:hypothetical protein